MTQVASLDVILRDGTTLRLRPPGTGEADAVAELFARLSPESSARRFHGPASAAPWLVQAALDPDWRERGSLVGTYATDDGERIVALATYERLRNPAAAEVAFVVADEFQGRGVGTRLLEQLAALAAEAGVERFVADVLAENTPMLRVFADAGFQETQHREGDEIRVELRLERTAGYFERLDERDHLAVTESLRPFFTPKSVAVAGASPRPGSIGGALFRNVRASGFPGALYAVNREGVPVDGETGYASFDDLPGPVDLAFVCVPAAAVIGIVESALRHGTRAVCVISAGFAELGSEGEARQEELLALVRAHGARLVGPNCIGIALADPPLNGTFAGARFPAGNIAFCSQSGALGLALLALAGERGVGFSAFVSIGNKADVSANDLLEHWEDDERTDVVLLYLESFGNPRRFGRIARRVARRKPILALKSGTTRAGSRAAASHTGALAGSDAAVEALFRQAGVIRAPTLEELVDTAALLSVQPAPEGDRVVLLTNAGGLAILCADACEAAGLESATLTAETQAALRDWLPAEASVSGPVDMLGGATVADYARALPLLLADPQVDSVIVLAVPTSAFSPDELGPVLEEASGGKPMLAVGLDPVARSAVPRYAYPESAARALARAAQRAAWLRRPLGTSFEPEGLDARRAAAVVEAALERGGDVWLTPAETRELLDAYGIPFVAERDAATLDEAVAAADGAGLSGCGQVGRAGAPQDRRGRGRARARRRAGGARGGGADRSPGRRPADVGRRPRADRRGRPGSGLRPARRVRARRRACGADRRRVVRPRPAHRHGRAGTRPLRTRREARARFPRCATGRPPGSHGPRAPPGPAGRRASAGRGARPEPGAGTAGRLPGARRPRADLHAGASASDKDLVAVSCCER